MADHVSEGAPSGPPGGRRPPSAGTSRGSRQPARRPSCPSTGGGRAAGTAWTRSSPPRDRINHGFARVLPDQEARFHRHGWGYSHTIEVAALLLAEHRRPDDICLLRQAITADFGT
ncbi:hypothetical protein ACFQWA_17120 [Streptomyces thermogriseus]